MNRIELAIEPPNKLLSKMLKSLISFAILAAATMDSTTLVKSIEESATRPDLLIQRKLGKSGKGGKAIVHPDLHHHGYHPHHTGKAGKGETDGKSSKGAIEYHGETNPDADDDLLGDDGYEWSGDDLEQNDVQHDDDHWSSGDEPHDDHSVADNDHWWSDDGHHHGKSGKAHGEHDSKSDKGSKGSKMSKSGEKSGKANSEKGHHHVHNHWGTVMPSPAPTPCGKAGKDCGLKPQPTPLTLPPVCLTIPCSVNGVIVSPTDFKGVSAAEPPVPSPIGASTSDTTALVPITVAPSAPSEPGYPTWMPTSIPTTDIHFLTESANWFQTGKAYEVDSYTRARMGDDANNIGFAFATQADSSDSERLMSGVFASLGMLIVVWRMI